MARRPSLSSDPLPKRRPVAEADAPPAPKTARPPSRVNRRALTFWISPEAKEILREIAYEQRRKEQTLGEEMLNDLFAKYGKSRLAGVRD